MINDHALSDDLLSEAFTFSPAPGKPADRTATIDTALAEANRHIAEGNPARGEHLLLQIQRAVPKSIHIKMLLAGLYCEHGQLRQALPLLDEVLAVDTCHTQALTRKAHILFKLNRAIEAAAIAATVRTLEAENSDNLNNLGVYQMAAGHFAAAAEAYSAAISVRPDFIAAYHNLLRLPDQALDDRQFGYLDRLSDEENIPDDDRTLARLCISRHYRSKNERAREFEYLNRAKSTLAKSSPWDASGFVQLVDEITAIDPSDLEPFRNPRSTQTTPIFISSMPRAGSTLTEQLISTHPEVGSIGEAGLASLAAKSTMAEHRLEEPHWWRWLDNPRAQQLLTTIRLVFDRNIAGFVPTTRYVCEKSINNDIMLGLCLLAFPGSFVIHCRRNPLDICLSAYQAYLPQLEFTNDLKWLAERYRQHARLMEHWHRLFPGQIAEVHYENLVSSPDEQITQILNTIGLETPAEGLKLDQRNYTVSSASNWQVRQPIYQSSRHRWHEYREQLRDILFLEERLTG